MRTSAAQIVAVAPWFDITNSYQRYWLRARRWRNPEYSSECRPALFLALAGLNALPDRGVMLQRAAGDRPEGNHAHVRL